MRNIKKITAMLLSLSVAASVIPFGSAAVVSDKYNKTYIESFDEEETVFGDDGLIVYGQNATEENVTLVDSEQGGKYLQVASGGADVQINTKKGIFKHDVTVIDMNIRALFNGNFPLVNLINNGAKMGSQSNGIFRFVNSANELRAYNIETGSNIATSGSNEWKKVRIILDSINQTVTTTVNGTQASITAKLDTEWDNENVQLNFQSALNSSMLIDDLIISDGTYTGDVYMDFDFEHSSTIGVTGNNFFYGINKVQDLTVVYDAESENSYLDIANAAGNTVYTNEMNITAGRPLVVEFRLKTDATTNGRVFLRQSMQVQPTMFTFENGMIIDGNKVVDVSDGKFHTYRAVFTSQGDGFSMSKLVDNNWIGTAVSSSNTYAGKTLSLRFTPSANAAMALDDITIYYPQPSKLSCELDGKTDVALDAAVEMTSNTQINASTAARATITANGETVTYKATTDGAMNKYIYGIDGGLQPGTTYVIETGANGVRDMFDQFYNQTITFTTVEKAVETPVPTDVPTPTPTVEPNTSPSVEPSESPTPTPTAIPEDETEAELTYKINGEATGKLSTGTMEALLSLKTNISTGATARGYVAQFDENGKLISVSSIEVSLDKEGEKSKRGIVTISDAIKKVKLLVWDGAQTPLREVSELVR